VSPSFLGFAGLGLNKSVMRANERQGELFVNAQTSKR